MLNPCVPAKMAVFFEESHPKRLGFPVCFSCKANKNGYAQQQRRTRSPTHARANPFAIEAFRIEAGGLSKPAWPLLKKAMCQDAVVREAVPLKAEKEEGILKRHTHRQPHRKCVRAFVPLRESQEGARCSVTLICPKPTLAASRSKGSSGPTWRNGNTSPQGYS